MSRVNQQTWDGDTDTTTNMAILHRDILIDKKQQEIITKKESLFECQCQDSERLASRLT